MSMIEFAKAWLELKMDRRGVTALEYAIIGALIAGVIATGATTLGSTINTEFSTLKSAI